MAKSALEMLEELTKEEQKINERRAKLREQAAKEVEEAAIKHVGKLIELAEVSQDGVRSALKPLVQALGIGNFQRRGSTGRAVSATTENVDTVRAALGVNPQTVGEISKKTGIPTGVVSAAIRIMGEAVASEGKARGKRYWIGK